jgi:hypothetical protein
MNLFKELVISAPVSARLQFGYNENVIVSAIDTEVRKIKGLPVKANTFITLSQVDPETRKVIAQTEFNFFNLDPTSDFVFSNFGEQWTALGTLLDAMGGKIEDYEAAILKALGNNELETYIKTKDGAKVMQDALQDEFYNCAKNLIGDACPLLKCKLVVNKKGYLEIFKFAGWVLPMTSTEKLPDITPHELKVRAESMNAPAEAKQAKPDELGKPKPAAPAAEKPVAGGGGFGGL